MDIVDQQPAGMNAQGYYARDPYVCDPDVFVQMREVRATGKTRVGRSCCVAAAAMVGCYLTWGDGVFWTSIGCVIWGGGRENTGGALYWPSKV